MTLKRLLLVSYIIIFSIASVDAYKKGEKGKSVPKPPKEIKRSEELEVTQLYEPKDCNQWSQPGDYLSIEYNATTSSGRLFDSSKLRGPFKFQLSSSPEKATPVDHGTLSMCVGERRKMKVPPAYAYGSEGNAQLGIMPDETIFYEILLLSIDKQPPPEKPLNEQAQVVV